MLRRVRNGKMSGGGAGLFVEFTRAAVKQDNRRARFFRRHFDVLPGDASAPTGLQGLQRRFFCREARGIMLRGHCAARFTVSSLSFGEHAFRKARRALDGFAHAPDFDNVDADGNNHRRI